MTFLVILFACLVFPQNIQPNEASDPTADSVIAKFVEAKGGEAALRKIQNFTIKGKVLSNNEIVGEFEAYQAKKRHLSIQRFPNGKTRRHGTDGKLAWRIDVEGSASLLQGQAAKDYIRHYETLHESLEWKNQYSAILYAGKKTVQNTLSHHLIFLASDNRQINRYFSVESGFLIREEQIYETDEHAQILISEIGDYVAEKNGTTVSRSRLNHFGTEYSVEYKIESVEANALDDHSIFAVPDSVLKLREQTEE